MQRQLYIDEAHTALDIFPLHLQYALCCTSFCKNKFWLKEIFWLFSLVFCGGQIIDSKIDFWSKKNLLKKILTYLKVQKKFGTKKKNCCLKSYFVPNKIMIQNCFSSQINFVSSKTNFYSKKLSCQIDLDPKNVLIQEKIMDQQIFFCKNMPCYRVYKKRTNFLFCGFLGFLGV